MGEDMRDFRNDEIFCGKCDRRGGPRNTEDYPTADRAGDCPGEHGGDPDLIVTFHPEKLPKAINLLFKEGGDRLNRTVIMCQTGATIDDDAVAGFKSLVQLEPDGFDLVWNY